MRKYHLFRLALWLGTALHAPIAADAALLSPASLLRATHSGLIQRVAVGAGAHLPALHGDYILVDDDDDDDDDDDGDDDDGNSDDDDDDDSDDGYSYSDGGTRGSSFSQRGTVVVGKQSSRQQRLRVTKNSVVRQGRRIVHNQPELRRQIAKRKALAVAEQNKAMKLKKLQPRQQEYPSELNTRKTAETEKKPVEQNYTERKTTDTAALDRDKTIPVTPVAPTPAVTSTDEETDVINNDTINIIEPAPNCPDNFPELKGGSTVLYPRRTDYPAERTLCTGITAKGCYLRVVTAPSTCGVSQPACVAYCSTPNKTEEAKRSDPPSEKKIEPELTPDDLISKNKDEGKPEPEEFTAGFDEASPASPSIFQQALKWGPKGSCEYVIAACMKKAFRCKTRLDKQFVEDKAKDLKSVEDYYAKELAVAQKEPETNFRNGLRALAESHHKTSLDEHNRSYANTYDTRPCFSTAFRCIESPDFNPGLHCTYVRPGEYPYDAIKRIETYK